MAGIHVAQVWGLAVFIGASCCLLANRLYGGIDECN